MALTFINRDKELACLNQEYAQKRSALIVIYGRRRIGKTTLIKEFIKGKTALYLIATEESEHENKKIFQRILGDFTQNPLLKKDLVLEWEEIFSLFVNHQPDQKKILVIDEFQYLGKSNKGFPSLFQKIWDEMLADTGTMVIVCGSLVSMMVHQTLSYASPLYGRRTGQIRLKQVAFKDYGAFFSNRDDIDLIEYFAVTGGVPKYIEMFDPHPDIFQAIEKNILSRQSFLYEEPVFLLEKEVGEIGTYFSIIKTIAAGNHKLGKIAADLKRNQSGVTKYLQTLMELDVLQRIVPVTETNPAKSKKGLYIIKDNFIRFWFQFVHPYQNYLELDNTDMVLQKLSRNFRDNHVSFVYEDICREKLMDMSARGDLGFIISTVGKWWDKHTEIDIVGLSHKADDIIFAECKYTRSQMGIDDYFKLKKNARKVNYPPDARTHYALFSRSGFTPELLAHKKNDPQLMLIQG